MPRRRHQSDDGAQRHALARPGLADEAQHLPRTELEIDAVDRDERAARRLEARRQPADGEQRIGGILNGGRDHRFTRKSSASPSPNRLKPSPVTTIATPGKIEIHQAVVMKFLPSAMSTPHSAAGGCAPSPR